MIKKKILFVVAVLFFALPCSIFADSRAYRISPNQTIPHDTYTKIQLNAEDYDTEDNFDSTTNYRFTATKEGYYEVNVQITYFANNFGYYNCAIFKNGTIITEKYDYPGTVGRYIVPNVSDLIYLNVGDYLELYGYQATGANQDVMYRSRFTFMAIHKLFSMPDIYTLIENTETGASFYIDKTFSYGDLLLVTFLAIFLLFGILKLVWNFIQQNTRYKL